MPAIVACGSRNDAFESYCTALASAGQNDFPLLLVDSEVAVTQEAVGPPENPRQLAAPGQFA